MTAPTPERRAAMSSRESRIRSHPEVVSVYDVQYLIAQLDQVRAALEVAEARAATAEQEVREWEKSAPRFAERAAAPHKARADALQARIDAVTAVVRLDDGTWEEIEAALSDPLKAGREPVNAECWFQHKHDGSEGSCYFGGLPKAEPETGLS